MRDVEFLDRTEDAVVPLGRGTAPAFAGLTYPSFAPHLADLAPPFVAVGTRSNGEPSGLALAVVEADGQARVLSLFVVPAQRRHGLGRALVVSLAEAVRRAGGHRLAFGIAGANASRPAVEALLARLGWPPLACASIRVAGLAGAMAEAVGRWTALDGRVLRRSGLDYAPWGGFDEADAEGLARMAHRGLWVPGADALAGRGVEPRVCVAIRRHGTLVGWLLGRRFPSPVAGYADAPAIRYAGADVDPALAREGALVGAFWHAYARQAEAFGPRSVAAYHTATPRLVAMTRRRFAPLALDVKEVHEAVLTL